MASLWQNFLATVGWITTHTRSAYESVMVHLGFAVREIITTPRLAAPDNHNVTHFGHVNITFDPFLVMCESPLTLRRIFESYPLSPITEGHIFTNTSLGTTVPADSTALVVWDAPTNSPTLLTDLCQQIFYLLSHHWHSFSHFIENHANWALCALLATLIVIVILAILAVRATLHCLHMRQRWSALKDCVRSGQTSRWHPFCRVIAAVEHGAASAYVEAIIKADLKRDQDQSKSTKRLEKEKEELLTRAEQAEKARDNAIDLLLELQGNKQDLEGQVSCAEEALVTHEKIIEILEKDKTKLELDIMSLRDKNYTLDKEAESKDQRISTLEYDKKRFHEQVKLLDTQLEESRALKKEWDLEREDADCRLSDAHGDVDRLKRGEAVLKSDVKAKDVQLEKLRLEITTLTTNAKAKDEEIATIRKNAEQTCKTVNERQDKLGAANKDQAARITQLTVDVQSLQYQKAAIEAQKNIEFADLSEKHDALQFDYDKLTDQKAEEMTSLNEQKSELVTTNTKLLNDKDGLEQEIKSAMRDNSVLEKNNAALSSQLVDLEKKSKLWETEKSEISYLKDHLEARLARREREIEELKEETIPAQFRECEHLKSEAAALRAQILDLQQQLGTTDDARANLAHDNSVLEKQNAQLSDLKTELHKNIADLEAVLAKVEVHEDSLVTGNAALEAKNAELSTQISTLIKNVSTLRADHSTTKSENNELVREKLALAATISELNRDMTLLTNEISDVKGHLVKADAEKTELVSDKQALNMNISEFEEEALRLKNELEEAKTAQAILTRDSLAVEEEHNAIVAELETQKSMLLAQVTQLTEDNDKLSEIIAITGQEHDLSQKSEQPEANAGGLLSRPSAVEVDDEEPRENSQDRKGGHHDDPESGKECDDELIGISLPLMLHAEGAHSQTLTVVASEEEHDTIPASASQAPRSREGPFYSELKTSLDGPTEFSSSESADAQISEVAQSQEQQASEASNVQTSNIEAIKKDLSTSESVALGPTVPATSTSDVRGFEQLTLNPSFSNRSLTETPNTSPEAQVSSSLALSTSKAVTLGSLVEDSSPSNSSFSDSFSSDSPPSEMSGPHDCEHSNHTEAATASPISCPSTTSSLGMGPVEAPSKSEMEQAEFQSTRQANKRSRVSGIHREQEFIRFLVLDTLKKNTNTVMLPGSEVLRPHLEGRSRGEQFLALINGPLSEHVKDEFVYAPGPDGMENKHIGKDFSLVFACLFLHGNLTMRQAILAAQEERRSDAEIFCSLLKLGFSDQEIVDALIQLKPDSQTNDLIQMLKRCGHHKQKGARVLNEMIRKRLGAASSHVSSGPALRATASPSTPASIRLLPKAPLQANAPSFIPATAHQQSPAQPVAQPVHAAEHCSQMVVTMTSTTNGLLGSRYSFQQPDTSEPLAELKPGCSLAPEQSMGSQGHSPSLPIETASGPPHLGLHASQHSNSPLQGAPKEKPWNLNGSYHNHYSQPPTSNAPGLMMQNLNGSYYNHYGQPQTLNTPTIMPQNFNGQGHHRHAANSIPSNMNTSAWASQTAYVQQHGTFIPNGRGRGSGRGGGRAGPQVNNHRGGH